MRKVLNDILSKANGFVPIPQPRLECRILVFPKGSSNRQYINCPEQDCKNLVYFFDQNKSMIEILELHETDEWQSRVQQFHEWYDKIYNKKDTWTWETKDDRKSWNKGSSKRFQSLPASAEGRTDPYEETKPWKDFGPANIEEDFLYPPSGIACPVVKAQTMSKPDQEQYMKWIKAVLQIDRKKSKDEKLYCPYLCKHYNKHQDEHAQHRCTLCLSKHAPFQCARVQINGGKAKEETCKDGKSSSRPLMGS